MAKAVLHCGQSPEIRLREVFRVERTKELCCVTKLFQPDAQLVTLLTRKAIKVTPEFDNSLMALIQHSTDELRDRLVESLQRPLVTVSPLPTREPVAHADDEFQMA